MTVLIGIATRRHFTFLTGVIFLSWMIDHVAAVDQCPQSCICTTKAGTQTDISVVCTFATEIPMSFPSNTTDIFIATFGRPDIRTGSFSNMSNIQTISISGDIGVIETGAFGNLTGRRGSNQTSYIHLLQVDVTTVEPMAFSGITRFDSFGLISFAIGSITSKAFVDLSDIGDIILWFGIMSIMPEAMFYKCNNIGAINIISIQADRIGGKAFKDTREVGRFEVWTSFIGEVPEDAFGHMDCIRHFQILGCDITFMKNYAFYGLSNIYIFEISNSTIREKENRILEGMGMVVNYELQHDLVLSTPVPSRSNSSGCYLVLAGREMLLHI